ncbi:MAG: hypothetical protein QOI60_328 [Actinomycetota bacterium]|nr:hypothetical protein [Actinomycetota bacterium]
MTVVVPLVILALLAGLVAGGSLRAFERVRVHWWAAALVGLLLQAAPAARDHRLAVAALAASYCFLVAFALINRRLPGAWLVMLGLGLNLAVVLPNGGMPVSASAVDAAGGSASAQIDDLKHHVAEGNDVLVFMGDVIPVPGPIGIVLSPGDVLLYTGIAWFLLAVTLGRSGENHRPPARRFLMYRGKHLPPELRLPRRTLARWAQADPALPAGARSGT